MSNARAAVWRDRDGRAVKTTTDQFYCLNPVMPRDLAARTEDGEYETTLRCRQCLNCRRYDEHELRRRLAETYREVTDDLWIVVVEAELAAHGRLGANIRRRGVGKFEPALYRLGDSAFAVVARGERPALRHLRSLRPRTVRVEAIGGGRKPRHFRTLARGQLAERADYGAWTNRFYARGLARLPREQKVIEKRGGIRKRHPDAKAGVRAWRRGLSLYPSLVDQGSELVALLLKRDGDLNGRKCTHAKCPPDRCRLEHRAAGARSLVKSGAPVRAPSSSDMTGFRDGPPAAHLDLTQVSQPQRSGAEAGGVPRNPKTNSNAVTGGRDAGSPLLPSAWIRDWEARNVEKARARERGGG